MIAFDRVTFTYPGASHPALYDITLRLPSNQFVLILGKSGSGKSTLLRLVNGLVPHFSGGTLQGNINVLGLDPVSATPKEMSKFVGFVFQDPETQFIMDQVEDEIAFTLENAAIPPKEIEIRIHETLSLLGIESLRHRSLDTLSGGERQKVAIASVLALRPRLLLLDEPTSQLDPQSADEFLTTLIHLNRQLGIGILIAEHRLERVLPYVNYIVYLEEGRVAVASEDVRQALSAIPLDAPLIALSKALKWHPMPLSVEEAHPFIQKVLSNQHMPFPIRHDGHRDTPPYLECHDLEVLFSEKKVLDRVRVSLHPGEIVALLGRNGAGKTTLLRTLVGLVRPQQGTVCLLGQDISTMEVADICLKVGYLPQDPNALLFAETVREEMAITLRNHRMKISPSAQEALLTQLGITSVADCYPRDLSTGERQRVALAAILVTQPIVLLLDEPTRGMDYFAKNDLMKIVHHLREQGKAIMLATHDVELAATVADRVVLLDQGKIMAEGTPMEVLGSHPLFSPQIARLFPGKGWLNPSDVIRCLLT